MDFILGMDIGVFLAWIGTLLATILCIVYGLYYQFVKKSKETQPASSSHKEQEKPEED